MRKERKLELIQKLNWLERKYKFNKEWDNKVKKAFEETKCYSFEALITKPKFDLDQLINFKG